jgi:4-carboxymuconolactone decarboxylase
VSTERRPPAPDRAKGMAKMQDVYNFTVDPDDVPGDFVAYTVDNLFGDVWCRPGLSVFERRLMTIGVLAALGKTDLLDVQFQSALHNGELDVDQVREIVIHLTHYVGWPLATGISGAAERVIARRAPQIDDDQSDDAPRHEDQTGPAS